MGKQIHAFLEDFKADLLRSRYTCGEDLLRLDSKLEEKDRRILQLVDQNQSGLGELEDGKSYKVMQIKMDLSCVCEIGATLGDVLDRLFTDFERSFFSRTELAHEVLPKRVLIARNGIEVSVYLDSDAELNVG